MLIHCPVFLMRPGAVQALRLVAKKIPPMAVVFKDEKPSLGPKLWPALKSSVHTEGKIQLAPLTFPARQHIPLGSVCEEEHARVQ